MNNADVQAWLMHQQDAVVQRLVCWCAQNSGSYHLDGLAAMADLLEADFASLSVPMQRLALPAWQEIDHDGEPVTRAAAPALVWHARPTAAHRVLLLIHYDTVYPPDAVTEIRWDGNRCIAPGAVDAKGGIAVIHAALSAVEHFGLAASVGWTVVLNPDEEIGSPASCGLLQQLAADYDFAMVFEPALPDGAWVADRKGSGNFTFIVRGRSAHAGRNPAEGRNAVVQASRLVRSLDALNVSLGSAAEEDKPTINVGRIEGGGPLNRVPDLAVVRLNVRIGQAADEATLLAAFAELAERFSGDGFHCIVDGKFHAPVKKADQRALQLRSCMQRAAEAVGRSIEWRNTGGACDGSKLAAFGLPNIDTLGPRGNYLHSPQEFCDVDSILPAAL